MTVNPFLMLLFTLGGLLGKRGRRRGVPRGFALTYRVLETTEIR